jgi:hypothetical protein
MNPDTFVILKVINYDRKGRGETMTRNEHITALCDLIERMNTPNPLNPAGLSDLEYSQVMTGQHDDTWVRSYVPGE